MPRRRVLLGWGVIVLALTILVAGCADRLPHVAAFGLGDGSPEEERFPLGSIAESAFSYSVPGPTVAWTEDGSHLVVITFGSSSCPSEPDEVTVVDEQEIEVGISGSFEQSDCTADISPHATVLHVPDGISSADPLVAHIGGQQLTLPPA
ncbi:hypothetical protein [Modestobacter italicus]|uniref:hypothetical protein n=1 Tax=Modestobacter italicus (strain DSM 44449 / CECT 9708 / BC 501) TaxID=2732864 RepID=UPI001C953926|nr:hypothetical protein [Modestobacter italicus]